MKKLICEIFGHGHWVLDAETNGPVFLMIFYTVCNRCGFKCTYSVSKEKFKNAISYYKEPK